MLIANSVKRKCKIAHILDTMTKKQKGAAKKVDIFTQKQKIVCTTSDLYIEYTARTQGDRFGQFC
jgi:phage-related minor tail protein